MRKFDQTAVSRAIAPFVMAWREAELAASQHNRPSGERDRDIKSLFRSARADMITTVGEEMLKLKDRRAVLNAVLSSAPPVSGDEANTLRYHQDNLKSMTEFEIVREWQQAVSAQDKLKVRAIVDTIQRDKPRFSPRDVETVKTLTDQSAALLESVEQRNAREELTILANTEAEIAEQVSVSNATMQAARVDWERGALEVEDSFKLVEANIKAQRARQGAEVTEEELIVQRRNVRGML